MRIQRAVSPLPALTKVTQRASKIHPARCQRAEHSGAFKPEIRTNHIVCNSGRKGDDTDRRVQQFELGQDTTKDRECLGKNVSTLPYASIEGDSLASRLFCLRADLSLTVIAMATPMKSIYTLKLMARIPSSPEN